MDLTYLYDLTRFYHADAETVTLVRPASVQAGAETAAAVRYAQSRPADENTVEHPMTGALSGVSRTFQLWTVECGGLEPHQGYRIIRADGTAWAVERVERLAHGRRFRCHCVQRQSTP